MAVTNVMENEIKTRKMRNIFFMDYSLNLDVPDK